MMIQKDPPFFWEVSCDGCSAGEERIDMDDAPTFQDVVKEIKERDWVVRKNGREWEHLCPECQ